MQPRLDKLIPPLYIHFSNPSRNSQRNGLNASDKLFADAAREEADGRGTPSKSAYLQSLEQKHENWTGEENIQDAVLRMLVDKPWHTEFKVPSHVASSIKLANMPPPPRLASTPTDEKAKKKEKELLKRTEQAGRLGRARESTLDYRLGLKNRANLKGSGDQSTGARPNPDKIECGVFDRIKGRGLPLARTTEEKNPFIGREEFLMNRIVQRNGAAPPWVELQSELDTAVNTFRDLLRQSYTRRVVRTLTALHPPALLANRLTLHNIKAHRDPEWEEKERAYHDVAIEEINSRVRKYNIHAPPSVRRAYYSRNVEVGRLYEDCAEDVLKGLRERVEMSTSDGGNKRKVAERWTGIG
ncbi:hypothetical protein BT96DRAFT_958021 [Gymnopus androsaceus JB14]|uniref:DnaJ homologue subfamily C member 28 conserved domain-containing protein n=1 Tax=Gymnopus androsaceus JB14 TaxID=1447944 RepID=A0A6A4HHN3_9AGAR|nr:hypothetical protein BT96DRAFT_958021 [Gymnopus androsaceus JB14]